MPPSKFDNWPASFSEDFEDLMAAVAMNLREAEIVYFFDKVDPIEDIYALDAILDLSQAIDRANLSAKGKSPCVAWAAAMSR